jgi:hypothetical protein
LLVRQEGNRSVKRQIEHYSLDMIIAVGYRVKSQVATRFRQWFCRKVLHEKAVEKATQAFEEYRKKRCCNTKAISTEL